LVRLTDLLVEYQNDSFLIGTDQFIDSGSKCQEKIKLQGDKKNAAQEEPPTRL